MLEDYIIDNRLRYENHYLKVAATDVQIGGVAGAALLSAMIVDTAEGVRRGIMIDTYAGQMAWIEKYEKEVRRDEWGLIDAEIELLNDTYIELASNELNWKDLCPNVRLLDLALQLVRNYMHYLTVQACGNHIWECLEWQAPFAQWLVDAARVETRRQLFLQTDWMDAVQVNTLSEKLLHTANDEAETPTFIFEGEAVEDIFKRYYTWVWNTYQAQLREIPGSQPRAAKHRNYMVEQETDWTFLSDEIQALNEEQQELWAKWLLDWQKFITRQLNPERPVQFWVNNVSEQQQKQLTQFLRIQEKEWDYFKCLSAAIYALRQLGYVRRTCVVQDITRWMTEQLVNDYTTKNNKDQFARAWKELKRYDSEVSHFVKVLKEYGITRLDGKK